MRSSRAVKISPSHALAAEFTCTTVSLVFVVLRLFVRVRTRFAAPSTNPWHQDVIIVVAWLCSLGNALVDLQANHNEMWNPNITYTIYNSNPPIEQYLTDPIALVRELKICYWTEPLYFLALLCVKMSFLLMYRHLFPPNMKRLRTVLHISTATVVVGYALIISLSMFWCVPISRNWATTTEERCLAWAAVPPYLFATGFNILTDLNIYLLPFFLLPTLYRSSTRRQFVGIIACFSLGLLCIVCTICRIVSVGSGAPASNIGTWCAAEMATAIIAACSPPLRWYWMRHVHRRKDAAVAVRPKNLRWWLVYGDGSTGKLSWSLARSGKSNKSENSEEMMDATPAAGPSVKDAAANLITTLTSTNASRSINHSAVGNSTIGTDSIVVNGLTAPRLNGNSRKEKPLSLSRIATEKKAGHVEEITVLDAMMPPHHRQANKTFPLTPLAPTIESVASVPIVRGSDIPTKKKSMWRKWKKQRKEQAERKAELGNLTFGGVQQGQMKPISETEEVTQSIVSPTGIRVSTRTQAKGQRNSTGPGGFGFLHGQSFIDEDDNLTTTYTSIQDAHRDEERRGEPRVKSLRDADAARFSTGGLAYITRQHTFFSDSDSGSDVTTKSAQEADYDGEENIETSARISFMSDAFGKHA